MQPQQPSAKPVMDIAPPPKPVPIPNAPASPPSPLAAASLSSGPSAGIPTKTMTALPVKEAPQDPDAPEVQAGAAAEQSIEAPTAEKKSDKPKRGGQSVAGIVAATIVVMIALASLAIVVYLKS